MKHFKKRTHRKTSKRTSKRTHKRTHRKTHRKTLRSIKRGGLYMYAKHQTLKPATLKGGQYMQ